MRRAATKVNKVIRQGQQGDKVRRLRAGGSLGATLLSGFIEWARKLLFYFWHHDDNTAPTILEDDIHSGATFFGHQVGGSFRHAPRPDSGDLLRKCLIRSLNDQVTYMQA